MITHQIRGGMDCGNRPHSVFFVPEMKGMLADGLLILESQALQRIDPLTGRYQKQLTQFPFEIVIYM